MATTKSLGQKDVLDKFYTKPSAADFCVNKLAEFIDLSKYSFLEPSAGNGVFLDALKARGVSDIFGIDIAPDREDISQADFFNVTGTLVCDAILGNPPFGQQGSSAIAFFNHAAELEVEIIAFILPRSFRKTSLQNRLSLDYILVLDELLLENSFTLNDKDYSVPCVFQIWKRTPIPRKKVKLKTTSELIKFTSNPVEADFRIQRVGGSAGKVFTDKNGAPASNHYIINTSSLPTSEIIEICRSLSYPSINDVVGPKSLPKSELIEVLEEKVNGVCDAKK